MPIDYSKTVIYKIFCKDLNITDIYIGSTTDFNKRKNQHKNDCNNENYRKYNIKLYQFIRNNGGWDNFEMIIVEEYSCNSKLEAEIKERYFIEELKSNLNCIIPTRSKKEYYQDKKEHIKVIHKNYYDNNKNKIRQDSKDFYENNKNKIKERHKEYYENNKDNLNISINCDCGGHYKKWHKSTHFKSKIHQEYIKNT